MTTQVVVSSAAEAKARAERLRTASETFYAELYAAWMGEDWRALGYKSWTAYVENELKVSRGRSYQLLDSAKKNEQIQRVAPGADFVSEYATREVGSRMPDVIKAIEAGTPPAEAVAIVRAEVRAQPKKHARQGPRGLDGECERIARGMETLNEQFELAGDDALDYLDFETRRTFERTVDRMTDFCATWGERLQRPANPRAADDGEAA